MTTSEIIEANLAKPARASITPTSTDASQHSLPDQIAAAKFLKSEEAAAGVDAGLWPFGTFVISPPGAF